MAGYIGLAKIDQGVPGHKETGANPAPPGIIAASGMRPSAPLKPQRNPGCVIRAQIVRTGIIPELQHIENKLISNFTQAQNKYAWHIKFCIAPFTALTVCQIRSKKILERFWSTSSPTYDFQDRPLVPTSPPPPGTGGLITLPLSLMSAQLFPAKSVGARRRIRPVSCPVRASTSTISSNCGLPMWSASRSPSSFMSISRSP